MEEVIEQFESSSVSEPESRSNFEQLYKYTGKYNQQEERRKEILEIQKSNRNDKLDRFRGILELVNAVEYANNEIFHGERKVYYRPNIYVAGFQRASPTYCNVLMFSEWMVEKPQDLSDNWFIVPCPTGVRMLVVANQGITRCYTKFGHFRFEKRTALPGGNPMDSRHLSNCCVLDCFYFEKTNVMYVLDLLAWNNHPMTNGETEFRHYWLESQLAEIPELQRISKKNQILIKVLPKVSCTPESLNQFMSKYPQFENNNPSLDGLLFYHKKAHYVSGETPLVGWLFPFMINEILGAEITVNENYLAQKPADYVNQADFIEKFEAKMNKRKPKSRRQSTNSSSMETDRPVEEASARKPKSKSKKSVTSTDNNEVMEEMEVEETAERKPKSKKSVSSTDNNEVKEEMEAEGTTERKPKSKKSVTSTDNNEVKEEMEAEGTTERKPKSKKSVTSTDNNEVMEEMEAEGTTERKPKSKKSVTSTDNDEVKEEMDAEETTESENNNVQTSAPPEESKIDE